jgi:hypothetical protein
MAQKMLDLRNSKKSIGCQTGHDDEQLFISLSHSKHAILKHSTSYKDYVLSFNINSSKSFILTKQMWKILRPHLGKIDDVLSS